MASLKDIKRRIGAVRGTQKVTRAMKLVAAAKLKRAGQQAHDSRAYASEIYATAMSVSKRLGNRAPILWQRPAKINSIDLIVVTSDRGLCGGFNENLLRAVEEGVSKSEAHGIGVKLFVIGKKGTRYLSARGYDLEPIPQMRNDEVISWIIECVTKRFENGESAGANLAFNKFVSAAKHVPTFWNFIPLHRRGNPSERTLEYLYESTRDAALASLCNRTLRSALCRVLKESHAAELAARMAAMDNATRNATDMIAHLTFVYNRARQEAITSELMDIVGGAEALK